MTLNVLVTSFLPWSGRLENASIFAARGAQECFKETDHAVEHLTLPVGYLEVDAMRHYFDTKKPDIILSFGEGTPRQRDFYLEMVGHNLQMILPDDSGELPPEADRAELFATIEEDTKYHGLLSLLAKAGNSALDDIAQFVRDDGIGCVVNDYPSGYLCNRLNYHAIDYVVKRTNALRESSKVGPISLFVHSPLLGKDVEEEDLYQAGFCIAEALVCYREDSHEDFLRDQYYPSLDAA